MTAKGEKQCERSLCGGVELTYPYDDFVYCLSALRLLSDTKIRVAAFNDLATRS